VRSPVALCPSSAPAPAPAPAPAAPLLANPPRPSVYRRSCSRHCWCLDRGRGNAHRPWNSFPGCPCRRSGCPGRAGGSCGGARGGEGGAAAGQQTGAARILASRAGGSQPPRAAAEPRQRQGLRQQQHRSLPLQSGLNSRVGCLCPPTCNGAPSVRRPSRTPPLHSLPLLLLLLFLFLFLLLLSPPAPPSHPPLYPLPPAPTSARLPLHCLGWRAQGSWEQRGWSTQGFC